MQKYFIIKLKKEGWSDRKIAAEYHISRNTIRKYWRQYLESEKELIDRDSDHNTREIVEKLLDRPKYDTSSSGYLKYNEQMDQALRKILEDEKRKAALLGPHHKQKMTKKQIYQLLVDMGFDTGLTTISNMINGIGNEKRKDSSNSRVITFAVPQ